MIYTYIDGDNIGLKIETSFLDNNENSLLEINELVKQSILQITEYLIEKDQIIIFSGADGIICKGDNLDVSEAIDFIRLKVKKITFSIGLGEKLTDCYIALRYAKASNKNIGVSYLKNSFKVIDGKKTKNHS